MRGRGGGERSRSGVGGSKFESKFFPEFAIITARSLLESVFRLVQLALQVVGVVVGVVVDRRSRRSHYELSLVEAFANRVMATAAAAADRGW